MKFLNQKKHVTQHARIKVYQKEMRAQKRCGQCVSPWHDGICACGKWGEEQTAIAQLAYRLMEEGWQG
jgi:hypothetical protein